jgi:glycosyltransferase involved in cell wall biosynthesis
VSDRSLVSCIMPTADRRRFVPQAIRCFRAQDYPDKELVILDDGADSVADLVPDDPQVRYVRLATKLGLGAKRNECVRVSRGHLIMHWDDDDWMAPYRISYQVDALLREGGELCGLRDMLFHDRETSRTWLYNYPAHQRLWLAGGSLLYTRDFWQRAPFPNIQVGEDTRFVWGQRTARLVVLPDYRFYVAMIHASNTSPKVCSGPYWSRWAEDLRGVMGNDVDLDRLDPPDAERSPDVKVTSGAQVERSVTNTTTKRIAKLTIGVYVRGGPERIVATLSSLARCAPRATVAVLVDGHDADVERMLASHSQLPQLVFSKPCGGAAAFNRLARFDDSDIVLLLEAGVVLARGCVDNLMVALAGDAEVGLAGPSTNLGWNEQRVGGAPRLEADADEIDRFANGLPAGTRRLAPLHSLADFAYAVRRDVIDAIGAADEGYGTGPCWEMDYNIRAARAGFQGVWVRSAYAHRQGPTPARQADEGRHFESSKQRYQNHFCGLQLKGERRDYEMHCRGDDCEHFAPPALIQIGRKMPALSTLTSRPPTPLISCIMPTGGRPAFVQRAVRYFQQQCYANRELIIVDDEDGTAGQILEDKAIRHVRVPSGRTIGWKRNHACDLARGMFIAHWDDDDWYGPERLTAQVAPLLSGRAQITGLRTRVFFDLTAWRFWSCSDDLHGKLFAGDVHGGTLAFCRQVWERLARYPDRSIAEDADFLRMALRRGARLEQLDAPGLFMYLRHDRNAWTFRCGDHVDPRGWTEIPEPVLSPGDRAFYWSVSGRALPQSMAAVTEPAPWRPLVTCVMPTCDRRPFVARAIRYFLRQDYSHKELVIVDDGTDRVHDVIPSDPRVRYIGLDSRTPLGEKRNIAVGQASGAIIAHWDDDDWYHREYLSTVCSLLLSCGDSQAVAGLGTYLVHIVGDPLLRICRTAGVAGATLCYFRSLWEAHPYSSVESAEDAHPRVVRGDRADLFMVVRHGQHTWRTERGIDVTQQLRRLTADHRSLPDIAGPDDAAFYRQLAGGIHAAAAS